MGPPKGTLRTLSSRLPLISLSKRRDTVQTQSSSLEKRRTSLGQRVQVPLARGKVIWMSPKSARCDYGQLAADSLPREPRMKRHRLLSIQPVTYSWLRLCSPPIYCSFQRTVNRPRRSSKMHCQHNPICPFFLSPHFRDIHEFLNAGTIKHKLLCSVASSLVDHSPNGNQLIQELTMALGIGRVLRQ